MRILLVEDNKSIIKGLEYAFAQNGYSCEYCLGFGEALKKHLLIMTLQFLT